MPTLLIIGAGIGGLALSGALRTLAPHFTPLLYERAKELKEVGAALGVWPNATRILRHLGCLDPLLASSYTAPAGALRHYQGKILRKMSALSSDAPSIFAHRADLLNALRSLTPPHALHLDHPCTGYELTTLHGQQKVRATFANHPPTDWADALIAADGIHSNIRSQLLHDGPPTYRGYIAWRAVTPFSSPIREAASLFVGETWGPGQRFGFIPLGHNRVGWWATANTQTPDATLAKPKSQWKQELLTRYQGWHPPIPELLAQTPEESLLCTPIADRDVPATWGTGPITLLGDAAHPTTPNLGQGACMAIEDAATLAKALAEIPQIPAALRAYEKARIPRTRFIVTESRKFGRMGQWKNPLATSLRNTLLRLAPDASLAKQFQTLWQHDAWNTPL
jgi:2-polyprenyl-6-methoxyphenol hydroxylase-like FAD-dependent oxidoreductase